MKKSPIFIFRTVLVCIGFLLILFGRFMGFESTCDYYGDDGEVSRIIRPGATSALWSMLFLVASIIFALGYFMQNLAVKILVYIFLGLSTLFIAFVGFMSQGGWGRPCGTTLEFGFNITVLGSLCVVTATLISMHREK